MTAQLAPVPIFKAFSNDGTPLVGGLLYTYIAGTTTPQATYTDSTQSQQNTNPIVLNARGEAAVWLDASLNYKVNLTDSVGNQIPGYPVDNIAGGSSLFLYPRTAAEIAVGVVPTAYQYPGDPIADPRRYGAPMNASGDDTSACTRANLVLGYKGGILNHAAGPMFINTANITLPKNVTWDGGQGNNGIDNPVASGTYVCNGTIILNPTYTINASNRTALKHSTILSGLLGPAGTYPLPLTGASQATNAVAAFTGTAVTAAGDDVCLEEVLILGFAQAFSSSGYERNRLIRVYGDNTAGISIDTSTDIAPIIDCHMWPFLTTHQSWTTNALLSRSGAAFKTTNSHVDGAMFTNCFTYGYGIGFDIQSHENLELINCKCDGPSAGSGQIGFKMTGVSDLINIVGGGASGVDQGAYCNVTAASTAGAIKFTGTQFWGNRAHIVSDQHKSLDIIGCMLRDTNGSPNLGITLSGTVTGVTQIRCNTFASISTAFSIAAGVPAENCEISDNAYDLSQGAIGGLTQDRYLANGGNLSTQLWTDYEASTSGWQIKYRVSGGSVSSQSASPNNATPITLNGQIYDGSAFNPIAQMRFTLRATPGAGTAKGGIVFSTNQNSNSLTDCWLMNEIGSLLPAADKSINLGGSALRINKVFLGSGGGAGTVAIQVDASATTGAQTATFTATNKPGSGTTAPSAWLPVSADGTTYYIPLWT